MKLKTIEDLVVFRSLQKEDFFEPKGVFDIDYEKLTREEIIEVAKLLDKSETHLI